MEKLNFLGIGPKIGMVAIPFLAVAITLSVIYPQVFQFPSIPYVILLIAGIIFLGVGLVFYALTVRHLLKGLKGTKLMTSGPYAMCKNPLYASMILLLVPGLAFVLNSWLVLITSFLLTSCSKHRSRLNTRRWRSFSVRTGKPIIRTLPN